MRCCVFKLVSAPGRLHVRTHACALACACKLFFTFREHDEKVNDDLSDYLTFPDDALLVQFRHEWVMVPHRRPRVPVFASSKMPRAGMKEEEKARLCSLYFRPWSLCESLSAPPHVPHLLQLPLYPTPVVPRRMREKGKAAAEGKTPSWASSWVRYIRGNVVSEHSARLITRFLSLTMARSCGDGGNSEDDDEPDADGIEGEAAAPLKLSLEEAHCIIKDDVNSADDSSHLSDKAAKRFRTTSDVRARWSQNPAAEGIWDSSGNRDTNLMEEFKAAAKHFGKAQGDKAPCSRDHAHA